MHANASTDLAGEGACRRPWALPSGRLALFLMGLGPGLIGLCADNDAGGILSYLATGASHGLAWLLPALGVLAVPTMLVQWIALRVAEVTRLPYSRVLMAAVGRPLARLEALVLYAVNGVILVTEFMGMTLALSLAGVPRALSLLIAFALVLVLTRARVYPRIEQTLVKVAGGSLAFIPALLLSHPAAHAWRQAWQAPTTRGGFLLLALAGNTMAPWMIYWQQNAVWAGEQREPRQRVWDLTAGVCAMVVMAAVVMLLGGILPRGASLQRSPVSWIYQNGSPAAGVLFAVGLFDAGLLAACTISLTSLWTLREAFGQGTADPHTAPNTGPWQWVHLFTLALAAAVILWPNPGWSGLSLWAQALGAIWMPVSLALLLAAASNRRVMGAAALGRGSQLALGLLIACFVTLAAVGLR